MANTRTKTTSATNENKATPTVAQERETPIVPKEIDPTQFITVRNGFQGRLIYKSPRTGEKFSWGAFGDEQEMELRELRNAKSSCKKMFENNWFMFDEDEEWVIDYLGVRQFYKNSLHIDDFDSIFSMTPTEIKKLAETMSDGLKKSVAYRARKLIADGEIDSRKSIMALEEALDTELIEK